MTCPYLRYTSSAEDSEFDHDRPYCALEEEFVSPVRADICNERHDFGYETHCSAYRQYMDRTAGTAHAATNASE